MASVETDREQEGRTRLGSRSSAFQFFAAVKPSGGSDNTREQQARQRLRQTRKTSSASRVKSRIYAQIFTLRSRNEFNTIEIDEALIAKAANIGLIRIPKNGKSRPVATATPNVL